VRGEDSWWSNFSASGSEVRESSILADTNAGSESEDVAPIMTFGNFRHGDEVSNAFFNVNLKD
jgi:hypothetical protein